MLEFLRGKASDRKLRLFACACCRRMWHLLPRDGSRKAIEASELYADRLITQKQLAAACGVARKIAIEALNTGPLNPQDPAIEAVQAADEVARSALLKTRRAELMTYLPSGAAHRAAECAELTGSSRSEERAHLAALLRHFIGNPFRPKMIAAGWLSSTVSAVARTVYDERAFERMPILADALEEAGCDDHEILNHCRQPGDHVRGCWALDLVLGKG